MKKICTMLFFAITLSNNAQITLEHYYPYASGGKTYAMRLVKLSSAGYKYVMNDADSLSIFNLNHSLYLTIQIPPYNPPIMSSYRYAQALYVSDELFNTTPSDIEYFLVYTDASSQSNVRVYDQAGNTLFSKNNVSVIASTTAGQENFISYTSSGVKMVFDSLYKGAFVYSLPGILPCHDCTNGTTTSLVTNNNSGANTEKISNYPNPTAGQTTIEYNLPQGSTTADLVFYNMTGVEVKRFKVTNAFHDVLISTADLDAGTYYYQLQTADGFKAGKKMVVVK